MPASPTITVTDNEDGTATVAVTGSDAGTTNTAYTAPARGGSWTSGGNRTGDGNITVTPTYLDNAGGIFHWRVESSDGSVAHSNVVLNRVSEAALCVYERILQQVQSDIQAAALDGISNDDVILQTVATGLKGRSGRMILVCPFGSEAMLNTGTNQRDDIRYPVLVAFLHPGNRDQQDKRAKWLYWRQDVSRTFRFQHLAGVDEVYHIAVAYRDTVAPNNWFDTNWMVGGIMLQVTAREARTL
ncbi:MAG TPA: hypothetical protein VLA12_00765 [Planctomycetaceae bacterium]|nr:hypothetical protein [Planctomycetaceae bacterium]